MVSRYRDILEPPTSPSPFFDTNSDSSARRKSVESSSSVKFKPNNCILINSDDQGVYDSTYSKVNKKLSLSLSNEGFTKKIKNENLSSDNADANVENGNQKVNVEDDLNYDINKEKSDEEVFETSGRKNRDSANLGISSIQIDHSNEKINDTNKAQNIENQDKYITEELAR